MLLGISDGQLCFENLPVRSLSFFESGGQLRGGALPWAELFQALAVSVCQCKPYCETWQGFLDGTGEGLR